MRRLGLVAGFLRLRIVQHVEEITLVVTDCDAQVRLWFFLCVRRNVVRARQEEVTQIVEVVEWQLLTGWLAADFLPLGHVRECDHGEDFLSAGSSPHLDSMPGRDRRFGVGVKLRAAFVSEDPWKIQEEHDVA